MGQDPYHNFNQAHGLAFSVLPPTPPPPSLRNIYIGLKNDYPDFRVPKHGVLTAWADRGVLLLNTCLTVRAHNANSHANKGWEQFTSSVLEHLVKARPDGIVFMAWGIPAGKRVANVVKGPMTSKFLVLNSVHPSPLSASRGFFNCGHFKKANEWLREHGKDEVDWDSLSGAKKTTPEKKNNNNNNNNNTKLDY